MANPSVVTSQRSTAPSLTITGELPACLTRAVSLLLEEMQAIPLDELAAYAGISKFHLSRLFVRYLGRPPQRFHSELRLVRAKQLLRSGQRGADVAYALGFADQAHLSRRFKVRWGVSPRTYAMMLEA
jgi:transcriptional regulator GlxA family with amidase domain